MRGARQCSSSLICITGIIPAYAGSTDEGDIKGLYIGDHPRVCGEHIRCFDVNDITKGSSPRMRGAQEWYEGLPASKRIIPAYAGSTWATKAASARARDHPRVCGEHFSSKVRLTRYLGSSPRMRGALAVIVPRSEPHRIIPAYAGSTLVGRSVTLSGRDHPRVCGEHNMCKEWQKVPMGSSPRMRGARLSAMARVISMGIIPAYAGSTLKDPCNPNNMIDKISDF